VPAHRPGDAATILVVEERRRARNQLVSILAADGYIVFEAGDTRAALDLIDRQRPQLIISSANARPVGGADLVRRIRARPDLAHTPVAFYAGARDEQRARAAAARVGIQEVLTNSTSPDAVLRSVRALLAQGVGAGPGAASATVRRPQESGSSWERALASSPSSPHILVTAVSSRDLVRLGEVAGVLTAAAGVLRSVVGADVAACGFFDADGRQTPAAIAVDQVETPGETGPWHFDEAYLSALWGRESSRWSHDQPGDRPPAIARDGSPLVAAVGTPLASAGRVWGWLVAGRRTTPSPFSERDERLVALIGAHACTLCERLKGADGLQGSEASLPTRELQTVCANEVESLGVWEVDAALETLTWSDSLADLAGQDDVMSLRRCTAVLALLHADDRERVADAFRRAASGGGELDVECRYVAPDGPERTLQILGRRFGGAASRPQGLFGIACDVTERRRLEGRLLQAQRTSALGLLAASVAHDFNNVLTAILGQARLLADDLADTRHRHEMEQIYRTAERATELTRQLLVFSRSQTAAPTIVGVNDVIEDVASMLRRLIGARVELHTDLDPDAPAVRVDRAQLEQVILNLVVNARDAMPDGGRIDIRTTRTILRGDEPFLGGPVVAGPFASLSVADTGTGIDGRVMAHIFDPFFSTKARGEGTGLGLTTVSTVVNRCGGHLEVRSALGKGSMFLVHLPAIERRTPVAAVKIPTQMAAAGQGSRILVIEDEAEVRQLVTSALQRAGYEVVEAAGAPEAEALIARLAGKIDLVVADVVIPGGTGPETFRRLAEVRPAIRAIFMSGYPDDVLVASATREGGAAFLQKPFTIDGLLQTVRAALCSDTGRGAADERDRTLP
jgi:signal transduction histidine kinase/DNA-binding response OmpR family regulator